MISITVCKNEDVSVKIKNTSALNLISEYTAMIEYAAAAVADTLNGNGKKDGNKISKDDIINLAYATIKEAAHTDEDLKSCVISKTTTPKDAKITKLY